MKFYCHAYPNALVEGVRFTNHYAETFDATEIINLTKSPLAVPVEEDVPEGEQKPITRDERDIDYQEFTMTELREYLNLLNIDFPAKARRYELLKLLEEAKQ